MPNDTFADRMVTLRVELERRAQAREIITYGEMAPKLGLIPQGLGKLLDAIRDEEAAQRRPDLGCLVVNAATGFPGYVGDSENERQNALAVREAVFRAWAD